MKINYYKNELEDDFANIKRDTITVDENFKYINHNVFFQFARIFVYFIVMRSFAYLYCKIVFSMKIRNKKVLKGFNKKGYFLYGNHTQIPADAFIPNVITFPKIPYVIVHPDNVSLKGTKNIMMMLNALPTPTTKEGYRNFLSVIERRLVRHDAIVIYPEAHIWPYYTKIRNFKSVSFKYPVKFNDPSFCFTTTYQKRKFFKKPKISVYVDGPFYPDKNLSLKEQQEKLRDEIYNKMVERSQNSNIEYIRYEKIGDENE